MIYRSKTEIVSVILQSARSGSSQTKIMYDAYLSYTLVRKYIKFLMENGMLAYEENTHLYKITDKGRRFLRTYEEVNKFLSSRIRDHRVEN